jgi:uncharacterized protein YkwD
MKRALWIAAIITIALSAISAARAEQQLSASVNTQVYLPFISTAPPGGQTQAQYDMAVQVVALVNSERATAGCTALKMNDKLILAAQRQSQDMAVLGFFSHSNPDPSRATLSQRVDAVGYRWSSLGENIAAGYSTPAAVMSGWMSSAGHKANILNCTYTEIGVGYYVGGSYGSYWTQTFGRP